MCNLLSGAPIKGPFQLIDGDSAPLILKCLKMKLIQAFHFDLLS